MASTNGAMASNGAGARRPSMLTPEQLEELSNAFNSVSVIHCLKKNVIFLFEKKPFFCSRKTSFFWVRPLIGFCRIRASLILFWALGPSLLLLFSRILGMELIFVQSWSPEYRGCLRNTIRRRCLSCWKEISAWNFFIVAGYISFLSAALG